NAVQLLRHGARRLVGRRLLGSVLGLGSERKRSPNHRPLDGSRASRPLGRNGQRSWTRLARRCRQYRRQLELVRHESTRRRPACLRWIRGHGAARAWLVCRESAHCYRGKLAAQIIVDELPQRAGGSLTRSWQSPATKKPTGRGRWASLFWRQLARSGLDPASLGSPGTGAGRPLAVIGLLKFAVRLGHDIPLWAN